MFELTFEDHLLTFEDHPLTAGSITLDEMEEVVGILYNLDGCEKVIIININVNLAVTIITTRPKPPYGRQGLAGSWARIQSGGYILGRSQRLTSRLRRSARIG